MLQLDAKLLHDMPVIDILRVRYGRFRNLEHRPMKCPMFQSNTPKHKVIVHIFGLCQTHLMGGRVSSNSYDHVMWRGWDIGNVFTNGVATDVPSAYPSSLEVLHIEYWLISSCIWGILWNNWRIVVRIKCRLVVVK